ncbi:NifU family protein [Buchnera aphidicola]|uniref:NifU family protein n=1 Tax=Buchnera aphidicola TaxID=9 RepID=UPI002237FA09|nr:NifU family protein [Buchnera aphidicola]MCW5197465.1 NifU family protein [Buchnera aphidicola (Chaitophorus viminalis)]
MIKISENAQKYIYKLLSKKKKNTHIKIFVINPGTEKAECEIEYLYQKNVNKKYKKFKFTKFNVYIKKIHIPFLRSSEIKLIQNNLNFELILRSPYIKKNVKSSFTSFEEKINYFIEMNINPFLYSHGGKIILIQVNKKKEVIIKFQGGCNGCSMVSSTLKNMVEKRLLDEFPSLTLVRDITDHKPNIYSYY